MKGELKVAIAVLTGFILFFIFNSLEYDLLLFGFSKQIQSAIFAATVTVLIVKIKLRFIVLTTALIFLGGMILLSLFNLMPVANFLGSIGIGLLIIASIFNLAKDGFKEKL